MGKERRRLLIVLFGVALVVSLLLNFISFIVNLPEQHRVINNMRTETFEVWLTQLGLVSWHLEQAETNFDVKDAELAARGARYIDDIFRTEANGYAGFPHRLYYSMNDATSTLVSALNEVYAGNQTGRIIEEPIDPNIAVLTQNLTRAIIDLTELAGDTLSVNGVGPAQQFEEAGVLADIENYLEEIDEISVAMSNYYAPQP